MTSTPQYNASAPEPDDIEQTSGPLVLEFGTNWCGHCQAAQPLITSAFADRASVQHLKIEDGKGRRLGRLHNVKLWPTLIFMRDGQEIARLVRPTDRENIRRALEQIS